jgi:hypothetical protein
MTQKEMSRKDFLKSTAALAVPLVMVDWKISDPTASIDSSTTQTPSPTSTAWESDSVAVLDFGVLETASISSFGIPGGAMDLAGNELVTYEKAFA